MLDLKVLRVAEEAEDEEGMEEAEVDTGVVSGRYIKSSKWYLSTI